MGPRPHPYKRIQHSSGPAVAKDHQSRHLPKNANTDEEGHRSYSQLGLQKLHPKTEYGLASGVLPKEISELERRAKGAEPDQTKGLACLDRVDKHWKRES